MINIITRRYPAATVYVYPAQVQGPSAPPQLCAGIDFFNSTRPVDTIIIGRGGGSLEDLWAFNNETLARKVAASGVPVISAVGHETDFSLCDFAADLRAPTPSAAAELAVPDSAELSRHVAQLGLRLDGAVDRALRLRRDRVAALAASRILSDPARLTDDRRMALLSLSGRLDGSADRALESARFRLAATARHLGALDPFSILSRGYAAVFAGERAVRSVDELRTGDSVVLRLADGTATADITNTEKSVEKHEKNEF